MVVGEALLAGQVADEARAGVGIDERKLDGSGAHGLIVGRSYVMVRLVLSSKTGVVEYCSIYC